MTCSSQVRARRGWWWWAGQGDAGRARHSGGKGVPPGTHACATPDCPAAAAPCVLDPVRVRAGGVLLVEVFHPNQIHKGYRQKSGGPHDPTMMVELQVCVRPALGIRGRVGVQLHAHRAAWLSTHVLGGLPAASLLPPCWRRLRVAVRHSPAPAGMDGEGPWQITPGGLPNALHAPRCCTLGPCVRLQELQAQFGAQGGEELPGCGEVEYQLAEGPLHDGLGAVTRYAWRKA